MSKFEHNVRCQMPECRIDTESVKHLNISEDFDRVDSASIEMDVDCGYCFNRIRTDDFLECEECEQYVHVKCLRRPGTPGDFVG